MAFDAGFLRCVVNEIDELKESRIEKIYQPSNDEIIISLHSATKKGKVLINAGSNYPRINITKMSPENPQKAPLLCMLLRKHLNSGKLVSAYTYGFERACCLEFEAYDELGFKSKKYLIVEMMGKYSNIILTDSEKKILAVLKPVDFSVSMQRQLLIGMKYELPPRQDKIDTDLATVDDLIRAYNNASPNQKIDKFITSTFSGIAPSSAREIAFTLAGDIDAPISSVEKRTLGQVFFKIVGDIKENKAKPYLILNERGEPQEFSYIPIRYFGKSYEIKELVSFSSLVDEFFSKKGTDERIRQKSTDIFRQFIYC